MMIIMKANATPQQTEAVIAQIKEMGLAVHLSQGVEATVIGAIGETHNIPTERFEGLGWRGYCPANHPAVQTCLAPIPS